MVPLPPDGKAKGPGLFVASAGNWNVGPREEHVRAERADNEAVAFRLR